MKKIRLLHGKILIQRNAVDDKTSGGIFLPDIARGSPGILSHPAGSINASQSLSRRPFPTCPTVGQRVNSWGLP